MKVFDLSRPRSAVDSETTGIHVRDGERMVSIGAVRGTLDGGVIEKRSWLIDTGGRQSAPEALAIHRIPANAPGRLPEVVVWKAFLEFVGDDVKVFQNGAFDMAFFNDLCDRNGLPRPEWDAEDTMDLAAERFPGKPRNLDSLLRLTGISGTMADRRDDRHDVLDDCELTFHVWRRLVRPSSLDLEAVAGARTMAGVDDFETVAMEW
jgi:DNA polymerase-3 subunit epsilon